MYCRSGPLLACFPQEEITKNPVILLSRHATAQEEEVRGRHGGNPQIKANIITSYEFMGGIDSSDMMLYEIQVQLHHVYNQEFGGGVVGTEGQCWST
jgi:hypothetical protein